MIDVTYSVGPRFIDGVNIDEGVNASIPSRTHETEIAAPVTGFTGEGYEPGQQNKDGAPL